MSSESAAGDPEPEPEPGTDPVPVLTRGTPRDDRRPSATRRFGYLVAIVVNAVLWYLVRQLPDWEWPGFLTSEFDEILPWLDVSFGTTIVSNVLFLVFDPKWFRSLAGVITSAISVSVAVRTYRVFPFDFSGYEVDWSFAVRAMIIVAIVGTAIGLVAEVVRLIRSLAAISVDHAQVP